MTIMLGSMDSPFAPESTSLVSRDAMTSGAGTLVTRRDAGGLAFSSLVYEPGARLGWHVHTHAYLSFVETGSYTEHVGRLTRTCEASTLLLHAAGERHANVFHSAVRLLRVEACDSRLFDGPLRGTSPRGWHNVPSRRLCRRMLLELQAPDDVTPLALQGLALELVAGLTRASAPGRSREPAWLRRVDELLRQSFRDPLSLAVIAAHAGVHPIHLARTYRRYRSRTIGERIRELRLEDACWRLATTDDSIADIALGCGFADQSHLARLLRRRLG